MAASGWSLIVAFAAGGWVFGAVEAAFLSSKEPRALVMVFAAILASVPAMLAGVLAWGTVAGFRRLPIRERAATWFEKVNTRDRDADRFPVIAFHASILAALLVIGAAAALSKLVFPSLFALQEKAVGVELAMVMAVSLVVAALLGIVMIRRWLHAPLRKLDERRGLPFPRPLWARYLLFVALPLFAGLYPFLRRHGSMLSYVSDVLLFGLLVCGCTLPGLLVGRLGETNGGKRALLVGLVVAVSSVGIVAAIHGRYAVAASTAERSMVASLGGRLARLLTDVDGDGSSALFGGGDCAAFDGARYPGAAEVYGNGIDENCDGKDDDNPSAGVVSPAGGLFSGALGSKQVRQYNVVWVILEAVRADRIGAYGYPKPSMPYLSSLAKESLLFTRAYAQASATLLSVPSMFTGTIPGAMQWSSKLMQPQAEADELLFPERMKARGYKTGAVFENYIRYNFPGMVQGFDTVHVSEPDNSRQYNRPRRAGFANAKAIDWLARLGPRDKFFLVQYYVDPHGHYTRHPDIDNSQFSKDKEGDYDSELAWTDEHLRGFVESIRSRKQLWKDTILIVTADHGEEFYEHGTHSHSVSCHIESVHVPLLIRVPGLGPKRIDQPVALVDIVPTLLELLGKPTDLDRLNGQSLLVPALTPEKADPSRPIFCSIASITDKYGTFLRRAVRQGNYALLHDYTLGRYEFFDMAADPREQNDIVGQTEHAARVESMKALLTSSLTGNLRDHKTMKAAAKESKDPQ